MATVLLTGGTGMIGRTLCKRLQQKGYDVAILSRNVNKQSEIPTYHWNPEKGEIDLKAIEYADYIIHLAGENIGDKRWTAKRMQEIIDSRVKTAELIYTKIKEQNKRLKAFVSASAVGYYGTVTSNKVFTETDPSSDDFLGDTCKKWEQSANEFRKLDIRTVTIRTAVVLSKRGGALSRMTNLAKLGIYSALGNGKQYIPWIHIEDLCNIYIKAIEDDLMEGAYNAVAPDHKTNKEFTRTLAKVFGKPLWLPNVPAFIMRLFFSKMAGILLKGSRVSSEKIQNAGFNFQFRELNVALSDLLINKSL